jgi:chlorite dismutase
MARYIDADRFKIRLEKAMGKMHLINGVKGVDVGAVIKALDMQPTADVAPKSEVDRLQEELTKAEADVRNYMKVAEYQQSLSVKRYHEIKQLKEDVDRLQDINNRQVEDIQLAKAEVAREIFAEIENSISPMLGLEDDKEYAAILATTFAELKKKYTEGAQDV